MTCARGVCFAVLLGTFALFVPQLAHAAPCAKYTSGSAVPAGYGASYDLWNLTNGSLLNTDCTTSAFSIQVGNGDTTTANFAVYKTGYRWTGSAWQAITFVPDGGESSGNYIMGKAKNEGTLSYAGTDSYFVAFTCSLRAGAWKCGCRDTGCGQSYWQLQAAVGGDTKTVTPRFSQSAIDRACAAPLIDFRRALSNGTRQYDDNSTGEMDVSHAVGYLSLVAYFEPNRSCGNTTVKAHLADQLRNSIIGGRELAPNSGLNGFWTYSQWALAITLAKRTPDVWNLLSTDDKDRLDWIMRALTATAAHNVMYNSYPSHSLTDTVFTHLGYSFTNHWMGWYAVMVYATDYFGGSSGLNAFLKGFDYDVLMNKARSFGWTRMTSDSSLGGAYPGNPNSIKQILHSGGHDSRGNAVASIRQDFYTQVHYEAKKSQRVEPSRKTNDPWKIFSEMTRHYMFSGKVVNETQITLNGTVYRAGLLDRSKSSPYLGEYVQAAEWATHLCPEFWSGSYRSNGHYVSSGLTPYMLWAGFMRARGYWNSGSEGNSLKNHILRGFRDTQFKVDVGWTGRKNDGSEEIWTRDPFYSDFWGGTWATDIHDGLVAQ